MKELMTDIHFSPPPFEFDYLSPKISDEMSHSHQNQNQLDDDHQVTDQGVTKVETNERVVLVEVDRDGEGEGQEDVPMNTSLGMFSITITTTLGWRG